MSEPHPNVPKTSLNMFVYLVKAAVWNEQLSVEMCLSFPNLTDKNSDTEACSDNQAVIILN